MAGGLDGGFPGAQGASRAGGSPGSWSITHRAAWPAGEGGQPLWHYRLPTGEHMIKDKFSAQQTPLKALLRKSYYFF